MSQTNQITEDLVVNDAQAVAALKRVHGAVGRVYNATKGMVSSLGTVAGLIGAFSFGKELAAADETYKQVARLKTITGAAAADAHALLDAFELTGFGPEKAEGVIASMAKQLGRAGKAGAELRREWRRIGVDVKSGVVDQVVQMSEAARKGKLGVADLMRLFGVGKSDAAALLMSLRKGPEEFRRIMADTKGGVDVIDEAALESYKKMAQARRELADAWGGVVATLYKFLIPGITKFLQIFKANLEAIEPIAAAIGQVLSDHMTEIVALAKMLVGIFAANKVAKLLSGEGLGTLIRNFAGFGAEAMGGSVLKAGKKGAVNLGAGLGQAGEVAAAVMGLKGLNRQLVMFVGQLNPAAGRILALGGGFRMILSVIGRLSVVGVIIAVIAKVFHMLATNAGGFGKRLAEVFGSIWGKLVQIGQALAPVIGVLFKVFNFLLEVVGYGLLAAVEAVANVIDGVLTMVVAMGNLIRYMVTSPVWFVRNVGRAFEKAFEEADTSHRLFGRDERKAPEERSGTTVYNDFRGSKFDVTQQFAEGFDPDRIAVAFADKLAALSEKRIQSSFAPLFAVPRGGAT